jgi:hypothetical protein
MACLSIDEHPQQLCQLRSAQVAAAAACHCCQHFTRVTADQGLVQGIQLDNHVDQAGEGGACVGGVSGSGKEQAGVHAHKNDKEMI